MGDSFHIHEADWTPEKVRRVWAYFSNTPDADRKYFSSHSGGAILNYIDGRVPLKGKAVLDYGCGPGYLSERLLQRGIPAVGLEFSQESCEKARLRCSKYPAFSRIVHAEGIPTPLPDSTFDVILFVEVIEHLLGDEVAPTLQDIRRLLKPGGTVVITTPHKEDLDLIKTACPDCGCVFHPWQHVSSFTVDHLKKVAEPYFQPVFCDTTTFGLSLAGRLAGLFRRVVLSDLTPEPHLVFIGKPQA